MIWIAERKCAPQKKLRESPRTQAISFISFQPGDPMPDANSTAGPGPVLVSDFDGTMTRHDFFKLAIAQLLPADTPDHWADYRSGKITHFEALRLYFSALRKD